MGVGGCPPAYINPPPPPLSFTQGLKPSPLSLSSPEMFHNIETGLGEREIYSSGTPRCWRTSDLPQPLPLLCGSGGRRGESSSPLACEASRCCTCGTRHQADRLLGLDVGDDLSLSTTLVRERYPVYGLQGYDSVLISVFVFVHQHSVSWDM